MEAEGVGRLNGGLPPQLRLGKDLGRGWRLPPLSPHSSAPPSTRNLYLDLGIQELGESPRTLALGALGLGAGSVKGGCTDVSGGVCVAHEGGWAVSLFL